MSDFTNEYNYVPGTCNIGPKELKIRKKATIAAALFCVLSIALLLLFNAPTSWRLALFIPASALGVTFQQWYFKFCIAFGMQGLFNFGEVGKSIAVEQKADYTKDRIKVAKIMLVGLLFGAIVTLLFYYV